MDRVAGRGTFRASGVRSRTMKQQFARRAGRKPGAGGFSLLEIMVVVTIIGILAAIAWPSYTNYVLRSKRVEGRAALLDAAARQERHYSDNYSYSNSLSRLGLSANTESGYYTLSLAVSSANQNFAASAAPTFTDTECGSLTITHTGKKSISGANANLARCWGK